MPPPCKHQPLSDSCHLCRLYRTREDYRRLWDAAGPRPEQSARRALECVHLGAETGESVPCPTCPSNPAAGAKRIPLFACALHGQTTGLRGAPHTKSCHGCADKQTDPLPASEKIVRNLLYHVYPRRGNGAWQRNVGHILRRMRLFNGRRVVAVLTGPGCDPPQQVRDLFNGHVHEFLEIPNDPALREVATFEPLFSRVDTSDPGQVTFYGHAKGVTRPQNHTAHGWADTMYEVSLDYWPHVERVLRAHPLAGTFLKVGHGWARRDSLSDWHYSGSFWWFRNRDLFRLPDWRRIDRFWSGIEPYLSLHFPPAQAGCLFLEGATREVSPGDFMELYDRNYWLRRVFPALDDFRERHREDRREW